MKHDPYRLLGVERDADQDTISKAYRRLATSVHPDKGGTDEMFRLVTDAHGLLSDPARRAAHDRATYGTTLVDDSPTPRFVPATGPVSQSTVYGRPVGTTGTFEDGKATAGVIGELEVADQLAHAGLNPDTFVFHDLVPTGGQGNVDHVVLHGDVLIVVDAKRWAPGTYVCDPVTGETYRDGQRFEPGDARGTRFLTDALMHDIGWTGRWSRVLAVSCSDYDRLDLSGFQHPDFHVVPANEVGSWVGARLAMMAPQQMPDGAVARLLQLTLDRTAFTTVVPDVGDIRHDVMVEALGPAPATQPKAMGAGLLGMAATVATMTAMTAAAQAGIPCPVGIGVGLTALAAGTASAGTAAVGALTTSAGSRPSGALNRLRAALALPAWQRPSRTRRWGVASWGALGLLAIPVWVFWGLFVAEDRGPLASDIAWGLTGLAAAAVSLWMWNSSRRPSHPVGQDVLAAGWVDTFAHVRAHRAPVAAVTLREMRDDREVRAALEGAKAGGADTFVQHVTR